MIPYPLSKAQKEKGDTRKDLADKRPFGETGEQIATAVSEERPHAKMYP